MNPAFVTVTPLVQTCFQNAKHRVVSVLVFGDVMQSSSLVVCYECAEAGRERERERADVDDCETEGESVF